VSAADDEAPAGSGRVRKPLSAIPSREALRRAAVPLAVLALVIAGLWLAWDASSRRHAEQAGTEALGVARESIVAMLSYTPDTAERDLTAARDRLTGPFLEAYTQLITTVVIPDATRKRMSSSISVPAAAVVSAQSDRAVVLAYVNQTLTVGAGDSAGSTLIPSRARVSMQLVDGRWLIDGYDSI